MKNPREIELQKAKIRLLLAKSMIPPRFANYDFNSYETNIKEQKEKKDFCFSYAKDFLQHLESGKSLILCGTTGTGKTHLSCAIADYIINEYEKCVVFTSVIRLMRSVKDTYSRTSQNTEQQVIDKFIKADLLILDEVGVQYNTDAEKIILFEILNERYENYKPTILISNLTAEDLQDYVGERVMDRMKDGNGAILNFQWDSFRGLKKEEKRQKPLDI